MSSYVNTQSTVKLQTIVNMAMAIGDIHPILNVAGVSAELPLMIANDVMCEIVSQAFPWKWNEMPYPQFYTSAYQQDYAGIYLTPIMDLNGSHAVGSSVTKLSWLERGIVVDINNDSQPKPFRPVECGRQLGQETGAASSFEFFRCPEFIVNYFPNNMLYYGTWGDTDTGNKTFGNNPVPGSEYIDPLVTGLSMPFNPITQIQDANGNLLVLTQYGICGGTAPILSANSAPGTTVDDGTCEWTVVDPLGQGIRIAPPAASTGVVWQFNLIGQALPIRFTSLSQTLAPLPDQYEKEFRQGFIAQCYRYSLEAKTRAKFMPEWQLWREAIQACRIKSDRELEENVFTPARSIMGGRSQRPQWRGPGSPFFPGQ